MNILKIQTMDNLMKMKFIALIIITVHNITVFNLCEIIKY